MIRRSNAIKEKDKRTLVYNPDEDNISTLITEFQIYKKDAHFIKRYTEMEVFDFFKEIRWMKIIDERNQEFLKETKKRQNLIKAKYENYVEYEKWSDSPYAQTTRPLSKRMRFAIIFAVVIVVIIMLLIVIGLNKWW